MRRICGASWLWVWMRKKGKSNQTLPPTLFSPTSTMADFNAVAQQFTNFYYSTFDSNRANLAPLYVSFHFFSPTSSSSSDSDLLIADLLPPHAPPCSLPKRDSSMLTFEGAPFQGAANIVEKLTVNIFTSTPPHVL